MSQYESELQCQAPVRAPQEAAAQNRDAAEITVKANGEVKEGKETERRPSPSVIAMGPPGGVASKPTLESHYSELTRMIAEVGRDVKPAYTNSKVSADRLRKNLMIARGVLRECMHDLDRLGNIVTDKK